MSKYIKSVRAALQAIKGLPVAGVTLSTMGADGVACVEIDYADVGATDSPDPLHPIYEQIDAALKTHGCALGEGIAVDGIEGIWIEWPGRLVKVECYGVTALYDPEDLELGNHGDGVAFGAVGIVIGAADTDDIGGECQILWAVDQDAMDHPSRATQDYEGCADWDNPESIELR